MKPRTMLSAAVALALLPGLPLEAADTTAYLVDGGYLEGYSNPEQSARLYKLAANLEPNDLCDLGRPVSGIAFDPVSGDLIGATYSSVGIIPDPRYCNGQWRSLSSSSFRLLDLAIDPDGNTLGWDRSRYGPLVSLEPSTGSFGFLSTPIGQSSGGIAYDRLGTLYWLEGSTLSRIDLASGSDFPLGTVTDSSGNPIDFPSLLAIHPKTGEAWSATVNRSTGASMLYRIDLDTLVATAVGESVDWVTGIAFTPVPDIELLPAQQRVMTGGDFQVQVRGDSYHQRVLSYAFTVTWDPSLLDLDTTQGDQGFIAGSDTLDTILVNAATPGTLRVTAVDFSGSGGIAPGGDLDLGSIAFTSSGAQGLGSLELTVESWTAPGGEIGDLGWGAELYFESALCGDANGDGSVDIVDALAIAKYGIGLPPGMPFNADVADVNDDGLVDIRDALDVARTGIGLEPVAPFCPFPAS